MLDTLRERFSRFVREKAALLHLALDSTPMRLSSTGYGNATSVEIYVRTLVARSQNGEEMKYMPVLSHPTDSTASGVLSTIPLKELFIEDLVSRPCFKFLLITTDGAPTNKAAIRLLVSELQVHKQLIILPSVCSPHTLSNAIRWGLGDFPFGKYLRTSHGLDAARRRDFAGRVNLMLRFHDPPERHSLLDSNTFLQYVEAISKERNINEITWGPSSDNEVPSLLNAPCEKQRIRDLWISFAKLVKGQRGPFSKAGAGKEVVNLGIRCADLWPLGPSNHGELRYCVEGKTREDYIQASPELFSPTVPTPVASRWYDVFYGQQML